MAESNYRKAISAYRDSLRFALEIADDPFKAPEQTVETTSDVIQSAWALQVEFSSMMRDKSENSDLIEMRELLDLWYGRWTGQVVDVPMNMVQRTQRVIGEIL